MIAIASPRAPLSRIAWDASRSRAPPEIGAALAPPAPRENNVSAAADIIPLIARALPACCYICSTDLPSAANRRCAAIDAVRAGSGGRDRRRRRRRRVGALQHLFLVFLEIETADQHKDDDGQ